ncbi:hypothetical protein BH10ACI3_BH10ACI3_06950 [soil metagenome]
MNLYKSSIRKSVSVSFWIGTICLMIFTVATAQPAMPSKGKCELSIADGISSPKGTPSLFGQGFNIPDLRFRFVDFGNRVENLPQVVRIFYVWEWWEYPYPDHPRGVWNEANDIVLCTGVTNDEILIPAYKVEPKGWYSGKYARTPRFDHIEVSFENKECGTPRLLFDKKKTQKFMNMTALVSLPCGGLAKVEFVKE